MLDHIVTVPIDDEIPLLDQTPLVEEAPKDEIKEGRKVDHLIEVKETNERDPSGLQTKRFQNQIFDEIFEDLHNSSVKSTTIFKVFVGLRESNPDAYKPKMISVGPYHKKNPELRSMEKYKLLYLQRFLQRKEGIDVDSCLRELEKLKVEALKCYDDIDSDIVGKFSEMLLLDGCFVVEFFRECCGMTPIGEERIMITACMGHQLMFDLFLLENQLPFFVLTMLHHMTLGQDEVPFIEIAKKILFCALPRSMPASFLETSLESKDENIEHLLQILYYMSCYPSDRKTSVARNPSMEVGKNLCWNPLQIFRCNEVPKDKEHLSRNDIMPNATELCDAGVTFSKVGKIYNMLEHDLGDTTSLFDIKFENGLMEIPCFEVHDFTETTLRNLIAYEQQSPTIKSTYFSDFAVFMDRLIDSEKDVTLLRLKGIISNRMGEDNVVASFFNKIAKGIITSTEFKYKEECRNGVQYCQKPWNRMKANLRSNYFNSPWAGISTVAAIILLLLTVMQTVLSFISTLK